MKTTVPKTKCVKWQISYRCNINAYLTYKTYINTHFLVFPFSNPPKKINIPTPAPNLPPPMGIRRFTGPAGSEPRNLGQYCPIGAGLLMVAMRMYCASQRWQLRLSVKSVEWTGGRYLVKIFWLRRYHFPIRFQPYVITICIYREDRFGKYAVFHMCVWVWLHFNFESFFLW